MMPGIIISSIFSEQGRLAFHTTPWQNQLASAEEPVDNAANGFGIQISAPNFPRCARSYLFALQQTSLHQTCDRPVTDPTYARSFAQADSLRIR